MGPRAKLPWPRRLIYSACLAAAALAALELVLAALGPLMVFRPFACGDSGPDGARRCQYVFKPEISFASPQDPAVRRIVVAGESAVNGWPFPGAGFPEMMKAMLELEPAAAGRYEIINLGSNGINTAQLLETLRDGLPLLRPDLLIVYAGNNELLARQPIDDLSRPRTSRAVWWMRRHCRTWNIPAKFMGFFITRGLAVGYMLKVSRMEDQHQTWLFPPAVRDHARKLYLYHIREIVDLGRADGVPVVICTPGANLAEWIPTKSVHSDGIGRSEKIRIARQVTQARARIMAGHPDMAIPELQAVAGEDPDYAKAWFFLGKAELLSGRTAAGIAHLERAVDNADFYQETPPSWARDLRLLVKDMGVPLVDIESDLRQDSILGCPGFDLFVDGCHPTLKGNYHIALHLVRGLAQQGLLPPALDSSRAPEFDAVLKKTGAKEKALAMAQFNCAMVLAFLYTHLEYKPVALGYLDEAGRMGGDAGFIGCYQGYISSLLDRPDLAAGYFSRARAANEAAFKLTIVNKLQAAMLQKDPWLWVKKQEGEGLFALYPRGPGQGPAPLADPSTCDYRFEWNGRAYRVMPL
ncbi:MAG TPA: SGNH/GDSL hydrolase family protein [bacterium]|nr:SGNH/GDSL hydrolase family protein [bacterium]